MSQVDQRALATELRNMAENMHSINSYGREILDRAAAALSVAPNSIQALHPSEAAPVAWVHYFNDPDPQCDIEFGAECPKAWKGKRVEPLYAAPVLNAGAETQADQAKRDGDTAAIRRDIANLHYAQTTNHQSYPSAWNDAIDAALEIVDAGLSVEPVAPTQEQSNSAFEMAMRESWRMVDPFKPAGEPGSYARGQDSGIVAALQTVRNNYERALKAAPQPPIQPAFLSENEQAILQQALKRSAHVLDDQAVQPSHAAVCLTKPVVAEAMLDKLLASLCLDEEGLPDYDSLAEFDLRQAMRRAQPSNDKPSEPNIPLNAAAQAPDAATPGGAPHLRTPDAAAPDVRARAETLKQMVGDYWDLAYIEGKEGRDVDTTDGAAARKWHAILKAIDALSASQVERATSDVIAERQRQIEREGWTPEHDDRHPMDVIARAAAAYALAGSSEGRVVGDELEPSLITRVWPWSQQWWKPTTPRRNLVKAGALILAAIARYDRAALSASQGSTT